VTLLDDRASGDDLLTPPIGLLLKEGQLLGLPRTHDLDRLGDRGK